MQHSIVLIVRRALHVRYLDKEIEAVKDYADNIVKSMNDALIVFGPEGRIKTVNKATSDLLGYKENELIGKPVAAIFAEEEEEEEEEPFKGTRLKKLIDEGSIRDYNITYRTKSGEKIPVNFSGSVMRDKEGELVGIVGIARDMREIRRLMQKEAEEEERKLISRRIMRIREEEKRRFATALHDAIGNMVVGLSSSLFVAEEEIRHGSASRAAAKLTQTKKMVKETAAMMKKICVDIRPPALEISGLAGTLSELIFRFRGRAGIKTSHNINLPDDGKTANNSIEMIIYRLVQEALNNAAKHSKAKNLELIINHDADKVTLSVHDDGRGFNMDKLRLKKSSLGLKIMREDAESVGGSLLIDSQPGQGTVIKAEFPRRPASDPKPELSHAH